MVDSRVSLGKQSSEHPSDHLEDAVERATAMAAALAQDPLVETADPVPCLHGPDSTVNNKRYRESLLVNTAESPQRPMATKDPKLDPPTPTSRPQSPRFSLKPSCRSLKEHQTSSCPRGTTTSNTSWMG